jgi:hypothetical protein
MGFRAFGDQPGRSRNIIIKHVNSTGKKNDLCLKLS